MRIPAGLFAKYAAHDFESASDLDELLDTFTYGKATNVLPQGGRILGSGAGLAAGKVITPFTEPVFDVIGNKIVGGLPGKAIEMIGSQEFGPALPMAVGGKAGELSGQAARAGLRAPAKGVLQVQGALYNLLNKIRALRGR